VHGVDREKEEFSIEHGDVYKSSYNTMVSLDI
jgi:hypothetical protein